MTDNNIAVTVKFSYNVDDGNLDVYEGEIKIAFIWPSSSLSPTFRITSITSDQSGEMANGQVFRTLEAAKVCIMSVIRQHQLASLLGGVNHD